MGTYTQSPADVKAGLPPPYHDLQWASGIHALLGTPTGDLERLTERIFVLPGL